VRDVGVETSRRPDGARVRTDETSASRSAGIVRPVSSALIPTPNTDERAAPIGLGLRRLGSMAAILRDLAGLGSTVESPEAAARRLSSVARAVCASHGIAVELRGLLPRAPAVLVANHLSYIDPLLVAGVLSLAPIAKHAVARWPLVGAAAARLGVVFVDRHDPSSGAAALRAARRALAAGVCVLNFAEGTTHPGRANLPFRAGVFGLAARLGVPVVPIGIAHPRGAEDWWIGDAPFLPHYLRLASRARTPAVVHFGAPLTPSSGESSDAFAARGRDAVRALLRRGTP
jgi:1-acyl-sn-glycerol-3-phosphate acyltransferase